MGRARVYINVHSDYDCSLARVQSGFIEDLPDFIKRHDWIHYEGSGMLWIERKTGAELNQFVEYIKNQGATIYVREKRTDEWTLLPKKGSELLGGYTNE